MKLPKRPIHYTFEMSPVLKGLPLEVFESLPWVKILNGTYGRISINDIKTAIQGHFR